MNSNYNNNNIDYIIKLYRNNVSNEVLSYMPESLNTFGNFACLETIEMKMNSLKSLPRSFTNILTLKKIIFSKNSINELPEDIGKLTLIQIIYSNI